jgi:hypothetical protein
VVGYYYGELMPQKTLDQYMAKDLSEEIVGLFEVGREGFKEIKSGNTFTILYVCRVNNTVQGSLIHDNEIQSLEPQIA